MEFPVFPTSPIFWPLTTYAPLSTLNLYNCVVANNSAYHGGGMWITEISGYLNATNCQIYNNNAIWCGGCGIIENAQANFTNCKIYEK